MADKRVSETDYEPPCKKIHLNSPEKLNVSHIVVEAECELKDCNKSKISSNSSSNGTVHERKNSELSNVCNSEISSENASKNGCSSVAEEGKAKQTIIQTTEDDIGVAAAPTAVADFSQLEVVKVLSSSESNCSLVFEAKHRTLEGTVLVNMQKTPFDEAELSRLVSADTILTPLFHNDVYSKHLATLPPHLNQVQVSIVHPATERHLSRYRHHPCSMVEETQELYQRASLPFIIAQTMQKNLQWIYNILDGKSEANRVIMRDDDPELGFVLLPDLKWTGLQMQDLYLQALVIRRDLRSIRDLDASCLPLLYNLRDRATAAITSKYGIEKRRLRAYLHYLPSYYHLHLHFSALTCDAPGTWIGRAHLLSDVINNLETSNDYYKHATLAFTVPDNHPHPLAAGNQEKAEEKQEIKDQQEIKQEIKE